MSRKWMQLVCASSILLLAPLLVGWGQEEPKLDDSKTTKKLESLPRAKGPKKVVTIYEFRSGVPEVSAEAATDMFATALIKADAFAVAERQRLNEGVMREKELSSQGVTDSDTSQSKIVGADYIFEGTVSEANAQESSSGIGGTVRGLGVETSGETATIGLDVRVLDARNGLVLDSVNVRKPIKARGASVSGIGSFVQSFVKQDLQGADVSISGDRKEGVDKSLRECIEEAVYQLVVRYGK